MHEPRRAGCHQLRAFGMNISFVTLIFTLILSGFFFYIITITITITITVIIIICYYYYYDHHHQHHHRHCHDHNLRGVSGWT